MPRESLISDTFSLLSGREGEKKYCVVRQAAGLTSESNVGYKNSHVLTALLDLSEFPVKGAKHCDDAPGHPNKRSALTLNYLPTTNRAAAVGEGLR